MYEMQYVTNYRWYMVIHYLVSLGEQIALWKWASHTFFWIALVLNVFGVIAVGMRLNKLEKKFDLFV